MKNNDVPEAKYTRFGETIRHVLPSSTQCLMGCGGRACKWENPDYWDESDQAIKGTFSSWVLEDVVAMSRPSTVVMRKYGIIEQFKQKKICSIINLQKRGEHASCGPPLEKDSLFTYNPQEFMDNDIFFYNFGWKDYGVTSMDTILDMVKVMAFALSEGKVAVHCHAGLGRTGVLIASYLVYAKRMEPAAAIRLVRAKRGESIHTRGQIACIHQFSNYLRPLRIIFPQVAPNSRRVSLDQYLARQRQLLHGYESRELRFVPKIIHVITKRLVQLLKQEKTKEEPVESRRETEGGALPFRNFPLKRHNTIAEIQRGPKKSGEENKSSLNQAEEANEVNRQLSFVLPPRVSASDGELGNCHDELEPNSGDQLQRSWTNGIDSCTALTDDGDNDEGLVFDDNEGNDDSDEQLQKDVDEILEIRNNTNNNNTRSPSLQHSIGTEKNQVEKKREELNENYEDEEDERARSGSSKRRYVQIGPSPAVLPTGSPIKAYQNNNNSVKNRRISLRKENSMSSIEHMIMRGKDEEEVDGGGEIETSRSPSVDNVDESACRPCEVISEEPESKESEKQVEKDEQVAKEQAEPVEACCGINDEAHKATDPTNLTEPDDDNLEFEEIIEIDDTTNKPTVKSSAQEDSKPKVKEGSFTELFVATIGDNKENVADVSNQLSVDASSKTSGRKTPIMYRGERFSKLMQSDPSLSLSSPLEGSRELPKVVVDEALDDSCNDDEEEEEEQRAGQDEATSGDVPKAEKEKKDRLVAPVTRLGMSASMVELPTSMGFDDEVKEEEERDDDDDDHQAAYVARSLAYKLVDDEYLWEKVYTQQVSINKSDEAWEGLLGCDDARLLSALMWTWLEHLHEAVITARSVDAIVTGLGDGEASYESLQQELKSLGRSLHGVVTCIVDCLLKLPPLPRHLALSVVERAVVAMTTVKTNNNNTGGGGGGIGGDGERSPPHSEEEKEKIKKLTAIINRVCDVRYAACGRVRFIEDAAPAASYVEPNTSNASTATSNNPSSSIPTVRNTTITVS